MPVMRIKRRDSFTVIDNAVLNHKTLSLKATGLLCYLLSKPNGWRISSVRIANDKIDGRDSVRTAMRELQELGFISAERERQEDGTLQTVVYVYESPSLNPHYSAKRRKNRKVIPIRRAE